MANTVAAPVIAVAPDHRKKPHASTQPTWKRPTTQPATKLSWQSAYDAKKADCSAPTWVLVKCNSRWISVAATDIQRELHLTNTQVGALQSAFFASYALCQLSFVAGWVVGRF